MIIALFRSSPILGKRNGRDLYERLEFLVFGKGEVF